MSDMGDDFAALRQHSQEKRAHNRKASAEILRGKNILFECKNDYAHLIVRHADKVVDFWPGTGKWIVRPGSPKGRGVFQMLKFLGVK